MSEELLLKDEVYAVVGAAIEIHRELGNGYTEGIYQEGMELGLNFRGVPFVPQERLHVRYKGRVLKSYFVADLICYGQLLVELKAMDRLSGTEEAQVLNYLKATGLRVALLINFGRAGKLEWKRFVRTERGVYDPDEPIN
jgi:GxxExxY protein